MTGYNVIYDVSPLLKKDFSSLKKDKRQALIIKSKIEEYAQNPNKFIGNIKKLEPRQADLFRIRVGNYRIIFSKDDGNKILIVHRIGLRGNIYK